MTDDMKSVETYLGDGLYASFEYNVLWLRAPREYDDHYVALEPEVYAALLQFVDRNKKENGIPAA